MYMVHAGNMMTFHAIVVSVLVTLCISSLPRYQVCGHLDLSHSPPSSLRTVSERGHMWCVAREGRFEEAQHVQTVLSGVLELGFRHSENTVTSCTVDLKPFRNV